MTPVQLSCTNHTKLKSVDKVQYKQTKLILESKFIKKAKINLTNSKFDA